MASAAATWLLTIAGTVWAVSSAAQAPVPDVDSGIARKNGSTVKGEERSPAYQDRLIDDGRLEPDLWMGEVPEHDSSGYPRSLRLDGIYSSLARNGRSTTQYGVGVGAFLATPQYGAWTLDGIFGRSEDSFIATLWQRDMPFDGGWRATNGFGTLNSTAIDLSRNQPRWFLPSSPMFGASTEWRDARGTQLTAALGEPGVFTGLYVPGFKRLGGTLTTAGGQWSLDRNWTAGLQYTGAHEVTSVLQPASDVRTFSTRSWYGGTAWQNGIARMQFNALGTDGPFGGANQGGWADALVQDGRFGHGFGAFYLGSNLVWGNQPVGTDTRGAYYRINYASRQWLWDASIDYAAPLGDRRSDPSTFVSGSSRYQVWQDVGIGGGGNALFNSSTAWSAFAYVENALPALINRTQIYTARNSPKRDVTLSASQTWNVPAGTRLSTSVLFGRYDDVDQSARRFGLAVFGGGDIAATLSVDANLQWNRSAGDVQPTSLIGNVGFTFRLLPDLALIATLYHSQSRIVTPLQIQSPIDAIAQPVDDRFNERGALLVLRYERRAGSMAAPLGGFPGGGAGRVSGVVFLDANDDGRAAAGEQGAANVTVILDGRYSARTDAQGRFEFPAVAAGSHRIGVLPDNVPLPWVLVNDGRIDIDVPVRGSLTVDIPAQRMR